MTIIATRTIQDPSQGNGLLDQNRTLRAEYILARELSQAPSCAVEDLCTACCQAINDAETVAWIREDALETWNSGFRYRGNRSRRAFFAVHFLTSVEQFTKELAAMVISLRLTEWDTVARR